MHEVSGTPSIFRDGEFLDIGPSKDRGMRVRAIERDLKVSKNLVHKSLKNLNMQAQENQGSKEEESTVHE